MEDEVQWKDGRRWEEGVGGWWLFNKGVACLQPGDAWTGAPSLALSCPSCFSLISYQAMIQPSALSLYVSLSDDQCSFRDFFQHRSKKEKQNHKWNQYYKKNGWTSAAGIEINAAPRSLSPNLWFPVCFWPWVRFGRTLRSGYWIAALAPLRIILLSSSGCCRPIIRALNHEEQQYILERDTFNADRK